MTTVDYVKKREAPDPVSVRLDPDQVTAVDALAKKERSSRNATMKRLVDIALGLAPGERSPFATLAEEAVDLSPAFWPAPLLRIDVGAGEARLEMIPGADRRYGFRTDWLLEKGWSPERPERFGVYRLADFGAESMEPTIAAGSILLVDREADPEAVPPRSIWIVRLHDGLFCKRVTVRDGWLVLESDNRAEEYAPLALKVTRAERKKMLEGRVVWYATETA